MMNCLGEIGVGPYYLATQLLMIFNFFYLDLKCYNNNYQNKSNGVWQSDAIFGLIVLLTLTLLSLSRVIGMLKKSLNCITSM